MALWINQTLHIGDNISIDISQDHVYIAGYQDEDGPYPAMLKPVSRHEANAMSIALRMAAKRLEEIGKGLE